MILDTPIGPLHATLSENGSLVELRFGTREWPDPPLLEPMKSQSVTPDPSMPDRRKEDHDRIGHARVTSQLADYFSGRRRTFDLPLAPKGTPFQLAVWSELQRIPYGETISYAELARRIGKSKAVRAVGAANGANPIPVIIPCHRVIGSSGTLTGYGGGIERKQWLLALEGCRLF
jgi:methylated-DNA-[protein]-cysteine S-methyltransferase